MKAAGIARARLSNQLLGSTKRRKPGEVVAWLGAMQAQDFAAAKWAVGLRTYEATDTDVEAAFNEGRILRTHVMRPTWHFVAPKDIRSLLALTAARVHQTSGRVYRRLGFDGPLLNRCHRLLSQALRDRTFLTRAELAGRLRAHRIEADGLRLAYLLMHAELEGLICSGPRQGKQFTYALLDERAPPARMPRGDEALRDWTLRYFTGHGPAQVKDFAWWSGLTTEQARRGLELAASKLTSDVSEGNTYWFAPDSAPSVPPAPNAWLLSIYDEYTIAYGDRSVLGSRPAFQRLLSIGPAMPAVLIVDGTLAGTWRRVVGTETVEIRMKLFRPLGRSERRAVAAAAGRYGAFLGLKSLVST